jgi:hypothetical protein
LPKPILLAISKRLGGITTTGATGIIGADNNAVDASSPQLHVSGWGGHKAAKKKKPGHKGRAPIDYFRGGVANFYRGEINT